MSLVGQLPLPATPGDAPASDDSEDDVPLAHLFVIGSLLANHSRIDDFTGLSTSSAVSQKTVVPKLRPVLNFLNDVSQRHAPFEDFHSIHKAMVPYYGEHSC